MKEKSSVMLELNLVFENDYDVHAISNRLHISCDKCQNRTETRINPMTKEHNPGYWSIRTEYLSTDNFREVETRLFTRFEDQLEEMKKILEEGGEYAHF